MTHFRERIRAAYDAESFRREGRQLVETLADYLTQAQRGDGLPVLPWAAPAVNVDRFAAAFPEEPTGNFAELVARVLSSSNHLHHPRYVGHQVTAPVPLAALCDAVSSLLNNGMAVYEMGPVSTAMERNVLRWMAARLGLPETADGVLTSGGSLGNLTALLAARQAKAGYDAWNDGAHAGPPLAVLVPSTAHYSLSRATRVMGWGAQGLIPVAVDERFRLRPEALAPALEQATRAGRKVIAVVASAGSTATGAFDPLEPVADFCEQHGLWFHVDAAHGAAAVLSATHRHQVRGIDRADSLIWDAHKGLLMPALVTAVLFRDGARSFESFAQEASYLFDGTERPWSDVGLRTMECTKEMMALKLYTCLSVLGTRLFADAVTESYAQTRRFAERLSAAGDFQVPVSPDCNILCFRHTPAHVPPEEWDRLQARLRERLVTRGDFYLVQTKLPGGVYLRVTLINPLTSDADLDAMMEALRTAARR
ncbi:pyridoxal phosphate-dependent decarboxylase family protein [Myxococcus stipitatus]|uniref:pyridoxal phosphate-dependent decarboxylase family protein n=1 Tax=Myxococcus stipitatus TaxID=83455 RepID=UPI0030D5A352